MLGVKIRSHRVAGSCALALGVALALAGCELRLRDDESAYDDYDDYDDYRPASSPGVTNGRPDPSPPSVPDIPYAPDIDRDRPDAVAPSGEDYSGPGIDSFVELVVLDPRVVQGKYAANAEVDAPWSFRAQMSWLAGGDGEALAFTLRWLDDWQSVRTVGAGLAPVASRPALGDVLLRPWLGEGSARQVSAIYDTSDADVAPDPYVAPDPSVAPSPEAPTPPGGYAAAPPAGYGKLPPEAWAAAPFRLIAIVNRVDLASDACGDDAGELRYVYTATAARGERALDLTLIVEIPYPRTRSAAGWARAWQEVGAQSGDARDRRLLELTREVALEADPLRARVRSNERALSSGADPWQMREFGLALSSTGELALRQEPLAFTPRADVDLGALAEHLLSHSDEVLAGGSELPEALRAGTAEIAAPDFSWRVPGISERLRSAFSVATCNGCHGGDTNTERFQHIAPAATYGEPARLSRFLYDASAPSDELGRRAALLEELSSVTCPDEAAPSGGYKR
jgi:hypothetical protein